MNHYVNDFGDKTEKGYITNVGFIAGSFSNSATQDSPLNVQFLIDKDMDASIQLFEYAGNNPVKAYDYDSYSVNVKDRDGKALRLRGTNYKSNRLTIEKPDSKKLHDALLKGGKLQFMIRESDSPTTVYNFTIDNADGYLDAREELRGVK